MTPCPDCNGKGGYYHDPNPPWLTDPEFSDQVEWVTCLTCKGEGKLTPLRRACRLVGGRNK